MGRGGGVSSTEGRDKARERESNKGGRVWGGREGWLEEGETRTASGNTTEAGEGK